MPPTTRFLIVCKPRTGSNWLCNLLHSHPRILCHHEVFNRDAIYHAFGHADDRLAHLGTLAERDRDPARFLERLWDENFGRPVVGIKMLDCQEPELQARLLADSGVRKILLRRRSRVRAYLSRLRARATQSWHGHSYDGVAVRIEAHELLEFARGYDAFYASLRSATRSQPALEVVYEDLQREVREFSRLLEFLGVEAAQGELRSSWARQSTDSLREAIQNFDELALALRGSALESELSERGDSRSANHAAS